MRHAILAFVVLCAFAPVAEGSAILFYNRGAFNDAVTRFHLFSDFGITDFNPAPLVVIGNYCGFESSGDVSSVIFGSSLALRARLQQASYSFPSQRLSSPMASTRSSPTTRRFPQFFPNALNPPFGTAGGLGITSNLARAQFLRLPACE